ncbi:MAG: protoporphyrinogen oxidase [bacterium]|nr:protoporphyrinogen oxidase [bacterium]
MKHVAIVGGGISGIAAALELSQQPQAISIRLFESAGRLGGVLETLRQGPYLVERSADNFATLLPDALQLTQDFGHVEALIHPVEKGRQAFVLHRGELLPIPIGFSLMQPTKIRSILATKTLSLAGKLRLLGEYWVPRRTSQDDESLESFAIRRLGREVFENLVEPIVSGIFTADPAKLSMQATMPQFVEMEAKHGGLIRAHWASMRSDAAAAAKRASGARYDQFVAPREGMSSWIADLQSSLPADCIRFDSPVESLESIGRRWLLRTPHETEEFDGVILATPARVSSRLLESVHPSVAATLAEIQYASSAVVAVIVPKSDLAGRIDGFGMINPRIEKRASLAISYTSNKYPGRVPEGQILLRVFFGGALSPEMIDYSDERLFELAHGELREILGWRGRNPLWQAVIRWRNAMPQYNLGHTQRVDSLMTRLEATPTLRLCGAAYRGVGIPQCVRSGRLAARSVLAALADGEA